MSFEDIDQHHAGVGYVSVGNEAREGEARGGEEERKG